MSIRVDSDQHPKSPPACWQGQYLMARPAGFDFREGQLAVPLSQLKPIQDTDETTRQAVEDWLYWVKQGYEF